MHCRAVTQKMYEIDYVKKACREPQLYIGDDVYIKGPKQASSPSRSAVQLAQNGYIPIMRRRPEPHEVAKVQMRTVFIDEDFIINRAGIDRVTLI